MCSLFGLLDYKHLLSAQEKNHILSTLSIAGEMRGTDATGIAYNNHRGLQIFKRPLPAHRMRLRVSKHTTLVMGHTRMTTQGSAKKNYNNHPFPGKAGYLSFALAHNGVLSNDHLLRKTKGLPATKIETDSYVAVQLLEQSGILSFDSLAHMAHLLDGAFTITVMDQRDNLYLVKGNNPLTLYHWPKLGLYLYASIPEMLSHVLLEQSHRLGDPTTIPLTCGEILHLDAKGKLSRGSFNCDHLLGNYLPYQWHTPSTKAYTPFYQSYVEDLKYIAPSFGYAPEDIDALLEDGLTPEEIEDHLYEVEVSYENFVY